MSTQHADQPLKQVANLVNEATDVNWLSMVRSTVRAILTPLASLKLTVVLLVLAVLVIWVVTLEQTRYDIWMVKQKHFPALLIYIPFQYLFPPAWFGELQEIPGGFFMPSGTLILCLMIANLVAAHLVRMRVQATGTRLGLGCVALVLGVLACWGVIFYGQNPDGFQGNPPVSYKYMWVLIQVGMLGLAVSAFVAAVLMERKRVVEKICLAVFGASMTGALAFVFFQGQAAFIGDSAMRILWQLIQATVASLVLLAGCVLVFNRKGGIVLIHLGIGLLMVNELYVTMTNVEQRMVVEEGQTVSHAIDIRSTELMVLRETDDDKHDMVLIPRSELLQDKIISDELLPFDVECTKYMANSELQRPQRNVPKLATSGIGTVWVAKEIPVGTGVETDALPDNAAAYIRLIDKKSGEDIGTYMCSQTAYLNSVYDSVEVDGVTYQIGLRLKHNYKPYSITLSDVQKEDYVGTTTPKWFASEFVLDDKERNAKSDQRIWMNNPLRYGNETFYQSSYGKNKDGTEYTVIQIVENSGWMIPYVACMIVVVGLFAQFGSTLLKFLEKAQEGDATAKNAIRWMRSPALSLMLWMVTWGADKAKSEELSEQMDEESIDSSGAPGNRMSKADLGSKKRSGATVEKLGIVGLVIIGIFAAYVGSKAMRASRAKVEVNEMRLDLLGQIPVTHKGRIQPFDSLARNTMRQLANREEIVYPGAETKLFGMIQEKEPAVRWLAELIFDDKDQARSDSEAGDEPPTPSDYERAQLIRVEDLQVAAALGLPKKRKGLKYSLAEMEKKAIRPQDQKDQAMSPRENLEKLMRAAEKKEKGEWTSLEKRLNEVQGKLGTVFGLALAFGDPNDAGLEDNPITRLHRGRLMATGERIPNAVHVGNEEWIPLSVASDRIWLGEFAEELGATNVREFAQKLTDLRFVRPNREERIKEQMIIAVMQTPEYLELMKKASKTDDLNVLIAKMEETWDDFPERIYDRLLPVILPSVEEEMKADVYPEQRFWEQDIEEMVRAINGDGNEIKKFEHKGAQALLALGPAYRAGDAATFNSNLETYLADLNANPPEGYSARKMGAEKFYNHFGPFYISIALYIVAVLLTCVGWAFYRPLIQTSYWIIGIALLVHCVGLVLRVVISGRPPVTNLYSSFIFVSAASVFIMMIVERMTRIGIGNVLAGSSAVAALLWAWTISIRDGDTFAVLQAVLDTQFWLSTHVICISLGYSATVAAGLIGIAFLIGAVFVKKFDKETRRTLGKIIYGITCFALFFSFFGTVLGGLWGDDSWGRFWGWDPKENGALMIVFWNAVVLHARWGGMVRERGLAALAILGIVITLWSWEGVNQLGVGLHSYGVSEGRLAIIIKVAAVNCLIAALAFVPMKLWANIRNENRLQS